MPRTHARKRRDTSSIDVIGVVDGERLPPRFLLGAPFVLDATRCNPKAYARLCERLRRDHQVGVVALAFAGARRLAAVLPIGGLLAITPLTEVQRGVR